MYDYPTLTIAALIIAGVVSLLAFASGKKVAGRAGWLRRLGDKLYKQKISALTKPPLSSYQAAMDASRFGKGVFILAVAILFKSAVSGLLGLIVIFYLPLGVFLIPALAVAHGDQPGLAKWVAQVTALQTTSHLLAAAAGFALTWIWIRTGVNPLATMSEAPTFSALIFATSLATGVLAAWLEAHGHMRRGYL